METESAVTQVEDVQSRLESTLEDYQEQHRYERLSEIGAIMEETILQQELANALFEEPVSIDTEVVEEVTRIRRIVRADELRQLDEDSVEGLEENVRSEERRISSQIKERCIDRLDTVQAFSKLNQELEFMDQSRLQALQNLLRDWNQGWDALEVGEADSLEERITEARETGEVMDSVYLDAVKAIGDAFSESEIQSIVDRLLNEGMLTLNGLEPEEIQALSNSEIGPYLRVSLSDD